MWPALHIITLSVGYTFPHPSQKGLHRCFAPYHFKRSHNLLTRGQLVVLERKVGHACAGPEACVGELEPHHTYICVHTPTLRHRACLLVGPLASLLSVRF